jgi:hypothetical protein
MRFWVISVILLLGGAELYQWMRQFTLPLPVFILGGVFLAIASNYDKHLPFRFSLNALDASNSPDTSGVDQDQHKSSDSVSRSTAQQPPTSPTLPRFQPTQPSRSISFEIKVRHDELDE